MKKPTKAQIKKKQQETDIQKVVNYYFKTKGLNLDELKKDIRKKKIVYSRYVRPAKQLLILAGSLREAKKNYQSVKMG